MLSFFIVSILSLTIPITWLYIRLNPQFGGKYTEEHKEKYSQSKNWDHSKNEFKNLKEVNMKMSLKKIPKLLFDKFTLKGATPLKPIPVIDFNLKDWNSNERGPKFIWYGHAVLLLQMNGKNILIDPMFGEDASPIAPFGAKRFSKNTLSIIDQLPQIDYVLQTHDHYDHLDYKSILKLKGKVDNWFVALGVKRHILKWGIPSDTIREFDWWDSINVNNINFVFTPSRHFSGRGLKDRFCSLWGGWVIKNEDHSLYWTGDGGYGNHFKTVGEKYGPFDWTFVECGQYNEQWHDIHLYPEESVQAAIDAQSKLVIPVHWGGFSLALHPWKEPINRFEQSAKNKKLAICTPKIGETIFLGVNDQYQDWWRNLD